MHSVVQAEIKNSSSREQPWYLNNVSCKVSKETCSFLFVSACWLVHPGERVQSFRESQDERLVQCLITLSSSLYRDQAKQMNKAGTWTEQPHKAQHACVILQTPPPFGISFTCCTNIISYRLFPHCLMRPEPEMNWLWQWCQEASSCSETAPVHLWHASFKYMWGLTQKTSCSKLWKLKNKWMWLQPLATNLLRQLFWAWKLVV